MLQKLDPIERRVLGVLIEKSLAQPAYYPMTLNAVTVACNQKSNRDPEMNLDEDTVFETLEKLRTYGLVIRAAVAGSRVDRFKHLANEVYKWDSRQRAIMAELLLRGPQTLNELRTRASRMSPMDSNEMAAAVIESLAQFDPPHVQLLPRAPGQREARYTHLLYPDGEAPPVSTGRDAAASVGNGGERRSDLQGALAAIEALQAAVERLERRVEALESR